MLVYEGYGSYELYENYEGYGFSFKPFKAIKRALPKPIRKLKPVKFIKRATGSKHLAEALLKTGAIAGTAYLAMNPAALSSVGSIAAKAGTAVATIGKTVWSTAAPVVSEVAETAKPIVQETAKVVIPQLLGVSTPGTTITTPSELTAPYSPLPSVEIPTPYPTGTAARGYWERQYRPYRKSEIEEYMPLIALGGGLILLALLLRR